MSNKATAISRKQQRGITFLGLLFVGTLVAMLMITAAKVVPSVVEYQSITKAVERAIDLQTVAEFHNAFDKQAIIVVISSISG